MKTEQKNAVGFTLIAIIIIVAGLGIFLNERLVKESTLHILNYDTLELALLDKLQLSAVRVLSSTMEYGFLIDETGEGAEEQRLVLHGMSDFEKTLVSLHDFSIKDHNLKISDIEEKWNIFVTLSEKFIELKENSIHGEEIITNKEQLEEAEKNLLKIIDDSREYELDEIREHTENVESSFNTNLQFIVLSIICIIVISLITGKITTNKIKKDHDTIALHLEELEKVDIQKDEFASMISHELKTPLVPIMGYAELLKTPEMNMTSEQLECVNEIYTNAERLESLISDVLDVQKLAIGAMKFNKTKLDLKEFFTRIANSSAPLLSEKQIHLDVSSTDITIDTDENRLHQVFDNLIGNAVDFVPNGGIISIGAKPQKDDVLFYVKDNGTGIPKEKQKDLFKKFYQIDTSATRKHAGTGLGLTICSEIIEMLGGRIWVESEEGKGTTFYFTIPK